MLGDTENVRRQVREGRVSERKGDRGFGSHLETGGPRDSRVQARWEGARPAGAANAQPGCVRHATRFPPPALMQCCERKVKDRDTKQPAQGHTARKHWGCSARRRAGSGGTTVAPTLPRSLKCPEKPWRVDRGEGQRGEQRAEWRG